MACTETGYSTYSGGQTEAVQAKYLPRLFCEYFSHGIVRTYLYEFLDAFDNKADRDSNFGLVPHDLTVKPSYSAVKNLIALLSDRNPRAARPFRPGALDYTMAVSPVMGYSEPGSGKVVNYDRTRYVHHLLLQKRNGDYIALDESEPTNDPPVVYLSHDDESKRIAPRFTAFLREWEQLCYVGPESFMIEAFLDDDGYLSASGDNARALQSAFVGMPPSTSG